MIKDMNGKDFAANEVALFNSQYLAVFGQLAAMTTMKKTLEAQEKAVKAQIQAAMDKFGIKSIDNEFIKITRIAAGADKQTVDLDAFKEAEPEEYADLLKDYPKTVKGKAGYVRFDVKDTD